MAPGSVILCTGGYDHTIRFWEATTGECHRSLQFADSQVNCLRITQDKKYLAAAGNPHVRLYDIPSAMSSHVLAFEGHKGNVSTVGFQKDRKWMYTGSDDGTVKIWDMRHKGYQRDYKGTAPVNAVALHPNQGELVSCDEDGCIRVWDLTANKCSMELVPDGKVPMRSVTVASDASIVCAANNRGTVFAWKMEEKGWEPLAKVEAHGTYILKSVLSPDTAYMATTSSDKTVKIWNVAKNFALEKTLVGHQRWVWDCDFSADSAYLVTASSDKTAKLWDLKSGETILEYAGAHHKAITSIALNDSSE